VARPFNVRLHAVNIVTHPHSRDLYEKLMRRMFAAKQPVQLRGDRYGLMTLLGWEKDRDDVAQAARGVISTYTHIDMQAPWLNIETGSIAESDDTQAISIPEKLRPNLAQFFFLFDLKKHLLVVQGSSRMLVKGGSYKNYAFAPAQVEKYFNTLVDLKEVSRAFRRVDVTIVPDGYTVETIIKSNRLKSLSLTIKPPNTDTLASERGRVMARLNNIHAKTVTETFTALPATNLRPDEEMKTKAKIAAANGHVDARIATENGVVPISTKDKPLMDKYEVDTEAETEERAFSKWARILIDRIHEEF